MKRPRHVYILLGAALLSMGNVTQCPPDSRGVPTITCGQEVPLELVAGFCVRITNPCGDGQWLNFPRRDWFSFARAFDGPPVPDGLSTKAISRNGTERQVCAAENAFVDDVLAPFIYTRGNEHGRGSFRVSMPPLPVFGATLQAEPLGGGRYRLRETIVNASGRVTIEWIEVGDPNGGSFVPHIGEPIVQPTRTTTYRIRVMDAESGLEVIAETTIVIELTVNLVATPSTIDIRQTAILAAHVAGGSPPYTFSWDPSDSVAYEGGSNAIAAPRSTTTYTVTAGDTAGNTASASATVTVRPPPAGLTADFTFSIFNWGDPVSLSLDASTSSGDIVWYAWDFSWHTFSAPIASNNPRIGGMSIPQPPFSENGEALGTITLTVTDRNGATATAAKGFPF